MKKKSNWFWLGIIGVLLLGSLIWSGARLSGVSTPLPSFSLPPTVSREPVASATDTPDPTGEVTPTASDIPTPAASESPADTPTPEVSKSPTDTPAPAASDTPTPTASEPPVADPTPAPVESEAPPVSVTATPGPETSEEPTELVGPLAVVILGDYIVDVVDLGAITESYTKVYEGFIGGESNTVEFVPGDVRVIEATCPDQICISQSWLVESMGGILPVSCLPNSLAIVLYSIDNTQDPGVDGATN